MKRGKPTQGVGSPNEPSLDDESGVKAGLSRRSTHRGLGDGQAPKLVTMHGVAPPSDPPPPPSFGQGVSGKSVVGQLAQDMPLSALRPQGIPHFDGDDTPDEGEFAPMSNQVGMPGDRSQFRTAPGGGKNRVSGGRAAASAYVSPSTLAPSHGAEAKLQSVEVDSRVIREARFHQTEPSLVRRRSSHLPPEPAEVPMKKNSWVLPALLALGATVGVAVMVLLVLDSSDQSPAQAAAPRQPVVRAPAAVSDLPVLPHQPASPQASASSLPPSQPDADAAASEALSADHQNSRNAASERPTTTHADSSSQGSSPVPPSAAARPSQTATSRATPKASTSASRPATAAPRTSAPKATTAPSRDLWIE